MGLKSAFYGMFFASPKQNTHFNSRRTVELFWKKKQNIRAFCNFLTKKSKYEGISVKCDVVFGKKSMQNTPKKSQKMILRMKMCLVESL